MESILLQEEPLMWRVGGLLMRKIVDAVYDHLEEMATNNSLWTTERTRTPVKEQKRVLSLDPMTDIASESD
ncbi:unnamed protein product [Dovyalis caffra]|uniref:Uncharacterized protein n=1 Tax=Dovyalis caffra TaxID=77055 RepID=A0AAV1RGY5_9ROSI|nr:unnamed protein product [Dovyalis caffra]